METWFFINGTMILANLATLIMGQNVMMRQLRDVKKNKN